MEASIPRRSLLRWGSAALLSSFTATPLIATASRLNSNVLVRREVRSTSAIRYCLNTSTIREQGLNLAEEVDLVAAAGFDGIEPWIQEIATFEERGGKLDDLAKRIEDVGIRVENAIGFANWIVDDKSQRAKGLEQAKREMELVRRLGGTRIAAPPVGATSIENFNLFHAAERYGELLRIGREIGVTPQLELWGFSKTLSRLGELAFVATECGEPEARILPDVYHIYKGGSDFSGLGMLEAERIEVFHINDYPAEPGRDEIRDADRVYPGDGVAPLAEIFGDLLKRGFQGVVSLELFNPKYWQQDAREVARIGLEKMKRTIAAANAQ